MNRYLGPEFPQIILKDNVEYKQANLSVPGWFTPFTIFVFFVNLNVAISDCFIRLRTTGWTGALFACIRLDWRRSARPP